MAPQAANQTLLSPAELAYLHTSLSQLPPIRPDLRGATDFRPLVAESSIIATANGSARVCFSDGTEAIAGIKAELNRTAQSTLASTSIARDGPAEDADDGPSNADAATSRKLAGSNAWVDVSIDIHGQRDDDQLPVFLSSMISESLLSSNSLHERLYLNERWHWHVYIDVLLLSPPLSYPLPLLSLTTHLALLDTRLPRRTSDQEDDPLFDDDWDAAVPLYVASEDSKKQLQERPPITLLVMTAGENIIFDPSKEELSVADSVLAVSLAPQREAQSRLKIISVRTIDPPSRLTPLGIPQAASTASTQAAQGGTGAVDVQGPAGATRDKLVEQEKGAVWNPPRGGIKRTLLMRVLKMCTEKGGVGEEVLQGLARVES